MLQNLKLNLEKEFPVPANILFQVIQEGRLFVSCGFDQDTMELDFKVGGKYKFLYQKQEGVHGEFLEIVPEKKVVFTWSEANTKVTLLIEPKGTSSLLKLTHELIPDAYWQNRFNNGWTYGFNDLSKTINQ